MIMATVITPGMLPLKLEFDKSAVLWPAESLKANGLRPRSYDDHGRQRELSSMSRGGEVNGEQLEENLGGLTKATMAIC